MDKTEKTITKEIKISKTIHPASGRVDYNMQSNVDVDELVGILLRVIESAKMAAAGAADVKTHIDKKENTYIG